jgi:hypothetical protein
MVQASDICLMYFTSARHQERPVIWTKGTSEAISGIVLDTLKTWIHRPLEDDFWNAEAGALITVAQRAIEHRCEMTLATTLWTGTSTAFPTRLMVRPFKDVVSVAFVDPVTGDITSVPSANYVSAPDLQREGQLLPADTYDWPDVARRPDAVRLEVTTGYGDAIPEDIMHALLMTVAALDSNRGDSAGGSGSRLDSTVWGQSHSSGSSIIPAGAMALLSPYTYRGIYMA